MEDQKELIHNANWKWLIILDSCRYDYFDKIYRDYLKGKLVKAESPQSCTQLWFVDIWEDKKHNDIIYFSANPFINSKKFKKESKWYEDDMEIKMEPWIYFKDIIDIWDIGWNDELNTVLPITVNEIVLGYMNKMKNKKGIIHYMQPHVPWIGRTRLETPEKLSREEYMKLAKKFSTKELEKAYEDNLHYVLENISEFVKKLENVVITSDHGEILDKDNNYENMYHPCSVDCWELKEVPWFVVETNVDKIGIN